MISYYVKIDVGITNHYIINHLSAYVFIMHQIEKNRLEINIFKVILIKYYSFECTFSR